MHVAHVDPVQRRIDEVHEREAGGQPVVPEAVAREAVHREAAGGEDRRLREQQPRPHRRKPAERNQQIEDRREVIAPGVHRRQRHAGRQPVSDRPHHLHVVAEIERVREQRAVSGHGDESHRQRVDGDAGDDDTAGSHGRPAQRRHRGAGRRYHDQREEDILRPREAEARERPAAGGQDGEQQQRQQQGRRLQPAGDGAHDRRVYRA